ncbi:MAG: ABC transporter permease [Solirubrobacteraceae bacterium]
MAQRPADAAPPQAAPIPAVPYVWADPTERLLVPARRRLRLRDNWRSRRIARVIGVRDIKVKYKQSLLGPLWLLVQPTAMLLGFALVFKGLAHVNTRGIPYWLFALIGLTVCWTYLQTVCITGANAQVSNREFLRRFTAPRVAFSNGSLLGGASPGPQ